MNYRPPEYDEHGPDTLNDEATDLQSLMAAPIIKQEAKRDPVATDFASIKHVLPELKRKNQQYRTASDYILDGLVPLLIFFMVTSFVFFLLDMRYVYNETSDLNIRGFAFLLIMGVVALNRVVARDGSDESLIYIFGLISVTAFYTFVTTGAYDVGSVAGKFFDHPYVATIFNTTLVILLWWAVNRLMHECCVDENLTAGDIGILTGTARRMLKTSAPKEKPQEEKERLTTDNMWLDLQPYDPSEYKPSAKEPPPKAIEATERLQKRHPGVSIFYFSIPVVITFAIGPRIVPHGGRGLVFSGWALLSIYTLSALSLLLLTSLSGIRAYFRRRNVRIPASIGPFWLSLGIVMILTVMISAAALPKPPWPKLMYIEEHTYDPWARGSSFRLSMVEVTPAEQEMLEQNVQYAGYFVLACLAVFAFYGLLRAAGAIAFRLARKRKTFPKWLRDFFDKLDRFLMKIARLPKLPRFKRKIRIAPAVSRSAKYRNPLAKTQPTERTQIADAVAVSYDAMCALAEDIGAPREPGQTPYEYLLSLPGELKNLSEEARELTHLYVRAQYSQLDLDPRTINTVRKFWIKYDRVRSRYIR